MADKFGADSEWHYTDASDADIGPVGLEDLRTALKNGVITDDTFIWHPDHCPEWSLLSSKPDIKAALAPGVPKKRPTSLKKQGSSGSMKRQSSNSKLKTGGAG